MTMSSLRDRFATLDRAPVPDLWADVEHRAAAFASASRVTHVAVGTPARSTGSANRTLVLLVGLLLVLLAGAVAIGSGLIRLPEVAPVPDASTSIAPSEGPSTALPSITPEPTATASASAGRSPWIVYGWNDQLWAVYPDGTGAHPIPGTGLDPIAWSDDGTRLLTNWENEHVLLAEVGDDVGPFVDTGVEVAVNEQWEAFDFAPDGERVV